MDYEKHQKNLEKHAASTARAAKVSAAAQAASAAAQAVSANAQMKSAEAAQRTAEANELVAASTLSKHVFERDVMWLEKSDDQGKYEFFVPRVSAQVVSSCAADLSRPIFGRIDRPTQDATVLIPILSELDSSQSLLDAWCAELNRNSLSASERDLLNKGINRSFSSPYSFWWKKRGTLFKILFYATLTASFIWSFVLCLFLFSAHILLLTRASSANKIKTKTLAIAKAEPIIESLRNTIATQSKLLETHLHSFKSQLSSYRDQIGKGFEETYDDKTTTLALKAAIVSAEQEYPSMCRIKEYPTSSGLADEIRSEVIQLTYLQYLAQAGLNKWNSVLLEKTAAAAPCDPSPQAEAVTVPVQLPMHEEPARSITPAPIQMEHPAESSESLQEKAPYPYAVPALNTESTSVERKTSAETPNPTSRRSPRFLMGVGLALLFIGACAVGFYRWHKKSSEAPVVDTQTQSSPEAHPKPAQQNQSGVTAQQQIQSAVPQDQTAPPDSNKSNSNSEVVMLGGTFNSPRALAVDNTGNVYVVEVTGSQALKKIPNGCQSATCVISLGGGFISTRGVAISNSGNVYVADAGDNAVKRVPPGCSSEACVVTIGEGFNTPYGVAVDSNENVFVADTANNAVKEILAVGGYSVVKNLGGDFSAPTGLVVDRNGNIFVADNQHNVIKEFSGADGYKTVETLGGNLKRPTTLALDGSGNVYVADQGNSAVKEISAAGGYASYKTLGSGFRDPYGVALDTAGSVYVSDTDNNAVKKLLIRE